MVPLGCRDGCKVHSSLTQHGYKLGLAGSLGRAVCWGPWLSTGSEKPYLKPKQVTGAAEVQEENQAPPLDVTAACVPGREGLWDATPTSTVVLSVGGPVCAAPTCPF